MRSRKHPMVCILQLFKICSAGRRYIACIEGGIPTRALQPKSRFATNFAPHFLIGELLKWLTSMLLPLNHP